MEFVSWDDEIPNILKTTNHVPNHQPVSCIVGLSHLLAGLTWTYDQGGLNRVQWDDPLPLAQGKFLYIKANSCIYPLVNKHRP